MRCGLLRHRVTVQERSATQSGTGEPVDTWSDVVTVWADVRDLEGREFLRGTVQGAEITTTVTMRYRSGITPVNRVVYGDRVLDIEQALNPDGRGRELQLLCREAIR